VILVNRLGPYVYPVDRQLEPELAVQPVAS
jgi:hypothetical protein